MANRLSNEAYLEYAKAITSDKSHMLQVLTVESKLLVIKRLHEVLDEGSIKEKEVYEIIDVTEKIMESIK